MSESFYSAFISYRHLPLDTQAAKEIEKVLEIYRVPRFLRAKVGGARLKKCFRDQDELPLSENLGTSISQALRRSDWLIVVCTPDLPKSKWCMREIDEFIAMGRREHIIPVLASGEPEESFPLQLRFIQQAGESVEVEPLSADIRATSHLELRRKLRVEKIRILARMLGVGFDDLRRRQRERRLKRALGFCAGAVAALLAFLAYAFIQNARIDQQRILAATNESGLLIEKSLLYSQQDKRQEAREFALQAYNVTQTIEHVNETKALDALATACYAGDFDTIATLQTNGMRLYSHVFSPDDRFAAAITGGTGAACFRSDTGEEVWSVTLADTILSSVCYSPDGTKLLVVGGNPEKAWVLDALNGKALGVKDIGAELLDIVFFRDNETVAFTHGRETFLWNLLDDQVTSIFDISRIDWPAFIQSSAAGAPKNMTWMSQDGSGSFVVGNLHTGEIKIFKTGIARGMSSCCFSPNENSIILSMAGTLCAISLPDGEVLWTQECENNASLIPQWVGDNMILFGKNAYDTISGQKIFSLETGTDPVLAPSGETTGKWQSFYGNEIIESIILNRPAGRFILSGSMYYDARNGKKICGLRDGNVALTSSHDGNRLLLGDTNSRFTFTHSLGGGTQSYTERYTGSLTNISAWNPMLGSENGSFTLLSDISYNTAFHYVEKAMYITPDGRFVVLTNTNDNSAVWDLTQGLEIAFRLYEPLGDVTDAAFSQDSRIIAMAGANGAVAVHDLVERKTLCTMTDAYGKQSLHRIRMNSAGNLVMVENHNHTVYWVYSVSTGALLYRMHALKSVADFGFDESSNNAVIKYEDQSASLAMIFEDKDSLLEFVTNSST